MFFGFNITVIAFVGLVVLSVVSLVYAAFYRRITAAAQTEKRLDKVAAPVARHDPSAATARLDGVARRKNVQATLKEIETKQRHKASKGRNPPMSLRLQQAGLKMRMPQFIMMSVVMAVVTAIISLLLGAPLLAVAGIAFVGGLGLPRFFVNYMRKRRQNAFINELPNAVEVIVRGVKAGLPLNDCLRMISVDANEPVRSEFRHVVETMSMGVTVDQAVGRLYERMPLPEANFFAIVIAIQAKAGGNLSEALGNLARVLRERKKMKAKIQAMSMEAKASASIIGSLPIIVALLVYLTSPDYIRILWTDPAGQVVIGCSALWMFMGIMVMRNMINFDI
ncbi:type II secretion system F family protein [Methylobrevis pamukkalensis]|uniref:Bacterial type II secretion system protein F domain protein n=1 Tax=Methylobrevis pamukkalensis TaxID=1439726 RepID=A0A1E3H5V1_9HYPH|nr:type II secretion system F family protein [Methylobrevis pamukkalensis]ODN70901.1 Bacterial type II secretion system protein F domain protein [Methylobrevis pamukkalensis]